jgi:hypothetical protein
VTLKPSYPRAFFKTFAWVFILITLFSGLVPHFQGKVVSLEDVLSPATIGGVFFSILVAVLFTPREITWSEERIKIRALFPGSGDFDWGQLEAWSPYGRGTFLIKFEGKQAFQISPSGFRKKDWKAFRSFLDLHFSSKKTLFWVGVTPIRFGKK